MCNDKCTVLLNKNKLLTIRDKVIVLEGNINFTYGLWDIPVPKYTISEQNYPTHPVHAWLYTSIHNKKTTKSGWYSRKGGKQVKEKILWK